VRRPILSVCVTSYNRTAFLGQCLKSQVRLDAGDRDDIEAIISGDAPPDDLRGRRQVPALGSSALFWESEQYRRL